MAFVKRCYRSLFFWVGLLQCFLNIALGPSKGPIVAFMKRYYSINATIGPSKFFLGVGL